MTWLYPFQFLFDWTILYPLRLFYQYGPIWKGVTLPDACAQITRVDASFWADQPDQCQMMFNRQFDSFRIGIGVTTYFLCVLVTVFYVACRCCFLRPMAHEIARAFKKNIKDDHNDVEPTDSRHCSHAHCRGSPPIQQT